MATKSYTFPAPELPFVPRSTSTRWDSLFRILSQIYPLAAGPPTGWPGYYPLGFLTYSTFFSYFSRLLLQQDCVSAYSKIQFLSSRHFYRLAHDTLSLVFCLYLPTNGFLLLRYPNSDSVSTNSFHIYIYTLIPKTRLCLHVDGNHIFFPSSHTITTAFRHHPKSISDLDIFSIRNGITVAVNNIYIPSIYSSHCFSFLDFHIRMWISPFSEYNSTIYHFQYRYSNY